MTSRRQFLQVAGAGLAAVAGPRWVHRRAADRPLNMVVLGDSIMWGQGLEEEEKFSTLVAQWLESATGRTVRRHVFAHSGAILGGNVDDEQDTPRFGEVPATLPSIAAQLPSAVGTLGNLGVPRDEVDLVLMDGGINDVSVFTILRPDPFIWAGDVRNLARQRCGPRMRALLPSVLSAEQGFPSAKVVVTNYYAIVSTESDLAALAVLLMTQGLLPIPQGIPLLSELQTLLTNPIVAALVTVITRAKLSAQSTAFHEECTNGLSAAVDAANEAADNRVALADVRFDQYHAYAAGPQTRLWLVGEQGGRLGLSVVAQLALTPDQPPSLPGVAGRRALACYADPATRRDPTCYDASMGHPNRAGARAYADAIIAALSRWVNDWKTTSPSAPVAAAIELSVAVEPVGIAGNRWTVIVRARDPRTGSDVNGQVIFPGVVGATGRQITFQLTRQVDEQGRLVLAPPGGQVHAVGYAVTTFEVPADLFASLTPQPIGALPTLTVRVTGSRTASSSLITVTAVDAQTQAPVAGRVIVGGADRGATGQRITIPACYDLQAVEGARPTVRTTRTRVPCDGVVRATGYADAPFTEP